MARAEKRPAGLAAPLADAHRRLGLEFGFRLWNGALVPADLPADAPTIAIADEGAVAGLARAPRLATLANLWAARRLDVVNGAPFDLAVRRPKARSRALLKSLVTPAAFRVALSFLFAPRGGRSASIRSVRSACSSASAPISTPISASCGGRRSRAGSICIMRSQYLAACSLVFERNACGVHQTLACKRARGANGLPPTRADLDS